MSPVAVRSLAPTPVLVLAAALATGGCTRSGVGPLGPGDAVVTLEHGGRERTARVHVPPSYDGVTPLPLVLSLHGARADGRWHEGYTGLVATADAGSFVLVHPEGTGRPRTWNAGVCCDPAVRDGVDDVGFLVALLDHLVERTALDRRRVHVTGISNGGSLAYRLACERPDLIAAIAPVAPLVPAAACADGRAVPVLHLHGAQDALVPPRGREAMVPGDVDVRPLAEGLGAWRRRMGCGQPAPAPELGEGCTEARGCRGGAVLAACVLADGGHTWPGASDDLGGRLGPTSSLDADAVVWSFLSRHHLPEEPP